VLKSFFRKFPVIRQFLEANRNLKLIVNECAATKRLEQESAIEFLKAQPRYSDSQCLIRHEAQFFSQNGEDGILAEIFRRIGTTNQRFVEIGIGNGLECNTTFLLQQGWQGWWFEACEDGCAEALEIFKGPVDHKSLRVTQSFVQTESVDRLFKDSEIPQEFDLLSIDVDRNTYYIWEALSAYRPRAVVIEYNGLIPPTIEYQVPYDPDAEWDGSAQLGAGLKNYESLGNRLGYRLVGCELTGVNAFFVREDLLGDHFLEPFTAERHFEPMRLHLLRDTPYPRKFEWDATSLE